MPCTNPVAVKINPTSPLHIPTAMNAGFTAILIGIFAYMNRNQSRVIRGMVVKPSAQSRPSAPQSSSAM